MALSEQEQQGLIITELDMEGNAGFAAYLSLIWQQHAQIRAFNGHLGYLYPKRSCVQYMLARARDYMTWARGKLRQQDRQRVQNLTDLLNSVQDEIDAYLGRQRGGRPPAKNLLDMMAAAAMGGVASGGAGGVASGGIQTGTITTGAGGSYLGATIGSAAPTRTVTTPVAPTAAVEEPGVPWVIIEGGFSQEVLPANEARTLVSIHNTSTQPLWVAVDEEATTGTPSTRIAAHATWAHRGGAVPLGTINVIGAITGQTFVVNEVAAVTVGATDADVIYTDLSGSIDSGGESQQLADTNEARVYFTFTNTSTEDLWLNAAEWASMDDNSILIGPGETKTFSGESCGPEDLYIIGPTTGQTWTAREGRRAGG